MRIRIAPKSLKRLKAKLRQVSRRSSGRSLEQIREQLNPIIRGWVNYYALADAGSHLQRLDKWLRRRMRQIAWKQWKTSKNRYQKLRERGVPSHWAKLNAGTSLGVWRLSNSPWIHRALNNAYWRDFGLESFLQQYNLRHT